MTEFSRHGYSDMHDILGRISVCGEQAMTMKQGGNKYIQSCVQDGLSPDDWLQYNWREGASQPSRMNGRIFLLLLLASGSDTGSLKIPCTFVF